MTNETARRVRKVYGIVLSASIVAVGLCLIWACLDIYSAGAHPFSREAVAQAFSPIAIPVYLCLGLVIGGFILDLVLPDADTRRKVNRNAALILKNLRARVDLGKCGETLQSAILAEVAGRRRNRIILAVVLAIGSVVFLCFALQPDAFHQSQINDSMIRNISILACCMAPAFGFSVYCANNERKSMEAEIALLKTAPAEAKVSRQETESAKPDRTAMIRNVIAVAAIALMIFGFCTGGTADVLTKAVNICTECVGLG